MVVTASEGPMDPIPGFETVGRTHRYTIGCFSDGLAYLICDLQTGLETLLTGEAAVLFHHELRFRHKAKAVTGSPIAARPWSEVLDDLVERFRVAAPSRHEGAAPAVVSDKN